jgi:hypothetical protein
LRNDRKVAGEYNLGLQIRVLNGSYLRTLNSLTVDIRYGSRLIPYSSRADTNWALGIEYSYYVQKLSNFYRVLVISSNVNGEGKSTPPGNPPGWDVTNNWRTIVTLRWIINSLGTENITINDDSDAAAYFINYSNAPQGEVRDWIVFNQDLDISTPVELNKFEVKRKDDLIELTWQTGTEVNNYGFEIERASYVTSPIQSWEKIGFIEGSGNSISPKDYSFIDVHPSGGSKLIYRLKQIDLNGSFEYYDEVEVELAPSEFALYQNYPNPFNPVTNIKLALPKAAKINLIVYNLLGEKIATLLDEDKEAGFYDVQFDASSFSSGIYIYKLTADEFIKTKKMTVMK